MVNNQSAANLPKQGDPPKVYKKTDQTDVTNCKAYEKRVRMSLQKTTDETFARAGNVLIPIIVAETGITVQSVKEAQDLIPITLIDQVILFVLKPLEFEESGSAWSVHPGAIFEGMLGISRKLVSGGFWGRLRFLAFWRILEAPGILIPGLVLEKALKGQIFFLEILFLKVPIFLTCFS